MSGLSHRNGFFNDCLLASKSDMGTYSSPADHAYFDGENTPVGGETCQLFPPRTDGQNALIEMAKDRVSYLNSEYHPGVLAVWAATGHYAEISRRLGYRLVIKSAKVTSRSVDLRMLNQGFAAPFAPRRAYLVFRRTEGGGERAELPLATDVATWKPGPITVNEKFNAKLAPGTWRVGLWLPDAAASLRADPRYAIRCTNTNTWDAATGENVLTSLKVTGVA